MPVWCLNAIRNKYLPGLALSLVLALALTLSAAAAPGPGSLLGEPEFLPVDEAFSFHVSLDSAEQVTVHFQIADAYYLYRQSLQFRIVAPERVAQTLSAELPRGVAHHDQYFGDVEVYYDTLRAALPLPRNLPASYTLELEYQGCAEAGLCYPPQTRRIELQP